MQRKVGRVRLRIKSEGFTADGGFEGGFTPKLREAKHLVEDFCGKIEVYLFNEKGLHAAVWYENGQAKYELSNKVHL